MKNLLKFSFLVFAKLIFVSGFAQTNIGIKFASLSAEFGEKLNDSLYVNSFGKDKAFAFEPGLIATFEAFTDEKLSFKFSTGVFRDRAEKIAGYSQITLNYMLLKEYKHSLYFGVGPAVHYRQSWNSIQGYIPENFYTDNTENQSKISWLSAEILYRYYLSKTTDFTVSLNHTKAHGISMSLGIKYWLGSKPRYGKSKGCNCPSYGKRRS